MIVTVEEEEKSIRDSKRKERMINKTLIKVFFFYLFIYDREVGW